MPEYLSPGVYIEETPNGVRPIERVGTRTAGFVGLAPNRAARPLEAVAITSWAQFLREYVTDKANESTDLAKGVRGFFDNQGSRCFVVNLGDKGTLQQGLDRLAKEDEVAIVAAPGYIALADYEALLTHAETLKDRVAILDPPLEVEGENFETLAQVGTADVPAKPRARRDGDDASAAAAPAAPKRGLRPRLSPGGYGAYYFPCIRIDDPLKEFHRPADPRADTTLWAPPSGHLAGVYARTDATRGVHKAPANEPLRGAVGLRYKLGEDDQGALNPHGVNVIRFFSQQGILVWGARTLDDAASEYRYIATRRFINMVEESIQESTRWIVFETNHEPLWNAIRRDVTAFLTLLWRQGMLRGTTPEQAFFVKCDADTNTEDVIDAGQVVTLIGLSVIRPAEFVIFRISQTSAAADPAKT